VLRATVGGLSIAYTKAGRGPALVLLHGFLSDSRVWKPQLEGLSDAFTIIAWDAPGAGQSQDPRDTFRLQDWADCLAGLLDVEGVESAHVLGLSWGGMLAQELYRRQPRRVRSLVLADTYAGWEGSLGKATSDERLATCLRDSSLPPQELVPKYLSSMHSGSASQEQQEEWAGIMADFHPVGFRLMAETSAPDTSDRLLKIDVPTLLIWGDADARSPLSVARQFHDAIPNAKLVVIPGAGHVSNLEAPAQFNAEVRSFCLTN
jgi:pimeloyl-ACP methyl ester carboxylesterase